MTRILLDANAPIGLRNLLSGCEVVTARYMGWDKLLNGELIARAEAGGFDILITADRNIRYQQNLTDRKIALIVLDTNHWDTIKANPRPGSLCRAPKQGRGLPRCRMRAATGPARSA